MSSRRSDEQLVEECKKGNSQSLEEILNRYANKAFHLAFRLTRNRDDAEEVLQDVFLTVFRKIEGFEGKSSFSSWFYRVTVNSALMKLRKRRQDRSIFLEDALPEYENSHYVQNHDNAEGESRALRGEILAALESAIEMLPDEYRPVFLLRDVDGLSSREVGRALNITIPAVKSRLHRSRLILRKKLLPIYKDYKAVLTDDMEERKAANS